ncbi:class I SAM-dependent methyltransferase [Bradyrhizobium sp. USDA 3364]
MVTDGLPENPYLYFGNLGKTEPQYKIPNFVGLCLIPRHEREIKHDLNDPLPVPDNSIRKIQAQDVMEHIPKDRVPSLLDEVYRTLEPGGVFRLSVPDYRSPLLKARTVYDHKGNVLADLMMGGKVEYDAKNAAYKAAFVTDGSAHLWFPTYEQVLDLILRSEIRKSSEITFHHYCVDDDTSVTNSFPENEMFVFRCPPRDMRASGKPISIIVDFVK